jgi:N-acetylglutamate synthase-like GNAT family acetyltransferase
MTEKKEVQYRLAEINDLGRLVELMKLSITINLGEYLKPEQVEASFELMGVDSQLIDDATYYVAEHNNQIVACGGWSNRATLFGGDHTTGRSARKLDPLKEAARIRAMYTHPDFLHQGIGSALLELSNESAKRAGFKKLELMSTVSGEPMYFARGFLVLERLMIATSSGVKVPMSRMSRQVI